MMKRLFIGSLSYSTTDEGLKNAFAEAGTVESAQVIMNRESGRSMGFGFVEMATEEEAKAAVEMFDGKTLDGRTIRVSEARPKGERPAGGAGGFRPRRDFGASRAPREW